MRERIERNYFNPTNLVLRGENLPSLLIGGTFVDLRRIGRLCDSAGLPLEFYLLNGCDQHYDTPGRFFLGRDARIPNEEVAKEGVDCRIEICECLPIRRSKLGDVDATYDTHGNPCWSDIPSPVITQPQYRIYRFDTRPPFAERLIAHTEISLSEQGLADLLIRFVQCRNIPALMPRGCERDLAYFGISKVDSWNGSSSKHD